MVENGLRDILNSFFVFEEQGKTQQCSVFKLKHEVICISTENY